MSSLKECEVIAVRKLENAGHLKALIDIRVGGALVIRGCTVMDGKNGVFVTMPRKVGRDGQWTDVVAPSDEVIKAHYEEQILKAFQES